MPRTLPIKYYLSQFHAGMEKHTGISKEEAEIILPFFEVQKFDKKEFVLHFGEVDHYFNMVESGLIRKYFYLPNGNVRTFQLASEGHFFQSEHSFHHRVPSEIMTQALESTILIRLHRDKMDEMFNVHPWTERIALRLVTSMAAYRDLRCRQLITITSPTVRMRNYISRHLGMFQRVQEKILASFLGIEPETFSRKKQMMFRDKEEKKQQSRS